MAQAGETLHDEINLQQVAFEITFVWSLNKRRYATEGTSWWTNLCSNGAMQHWCQDGRQRSAMILLACLPPSYENFVSSLIVSKDSITLEEVKSSLYSRELRLKAFGNGDVASTSGLSRLILLKGRRRRKEKVVRRAKLILRTSTSIIESLPTLRELTKFS